MKKNIKKSIIPRLLVVPQPHPEITRLFRSARRKAQQHGFDWEVAIIDTPASLAANAKKPMPHFLAALTLAEQMGAIITHVSAPNILEGVRIKMNELNQLCVPVQGIMVADTYKKKSRFFWRQPFNQRLEKKFGHMTEITAVPIGIEPTSMPSLTSIFHVNIKEIFYSLLAVALAVGFIEVISAIAPDTIGSHSRNKPIILILACAFAASNYGLLAGIIASVASFLVMSTLYIAPYYRLLIDDYSDAFNLVLFLTAGTVLSFWGSRSYGNRLALARRADRFNSLLKVHRLVLNKNTAAEAIAVLNDALKAILGKEIAFFLPSATDRNNLEIIYRNDLQLNEAEKKALSVCWEESKTTGVGAPYNPQGCTWRFKPLITAQDEIGVLGIHLGEGTDIDIEYIRLLTGIADQVALILERLQLGTAAEENKIQAEREKLRSMLLSSVSHDLKTPLASIIGSLSVFRSMGLNLPPEQRTILIDTALEEAQRLDSFITNILDMTRLESGQIELKEEWVDPDHLIAEVQRRYRNRLRNHSLVVVPANIHAHVAMDSMMVSQVIQNVLDNAIKYTPAGTQIDLLWSADKEGFLLSVRDHGPGIPAEQLSIVFDKYARIKRRDRQIAGTGLGLAIAKAVMLAQGGSITAENHPEGGAIFTLRLPKVRLNGKKKVA